MRTPYVFPTVYVGQADELSLPWYSTQLPCSLQEGKILPQDGTLTLPRELTPGFLPRPVHRIGVCSLLFTPPVYGAHTPEYSHLAAMTDF